MKAAIFQSQTDSLSPAERLDLLAEKLGQSDFDVVVTPELFMSGYNVGENIQTLSEPADGLFFQAIKKLAIEHKTAIIYGFPERDGNDIFNSALCVDANGRVLSKRRKQFLPPGFEAEYFSYGSKADVFELNGFTCAIVICYEAEFPENIRNAAQQGAEVVFVPTALGENWHLVAHKVMPTRAFENGVWFLYANHAGSENGRTYLGQSCICSPDGKDAARAGKAAEIISTTITREAIAKTRKRLPFLQDIKGR